MRTQTPRHLVKELQRTIKNTGLADRLPVRCGESSCTTDGEQHIASPRHD